jgi:two-component system phosphate regulon sensor histidine kinase PhoR
VVLDLDRCTAELGAGSPWECLFRQLHNRLVSHRDKMQAAELRRAAVEVRARRTSTEQLRTAAIVANLADPVLAVDEYNELVLANPSAEALFNFQLEGAEKRALADLVHCEDLLKLLEDTHGRKAAKERCREIELTDAEGRRHCYAVTARPLEGTAESASDAGGTPRGTMAVLRDISSQKEIQKRNAEFVSSVSHEMKTPLAGIKAYVELLADGDAEDEKAREEFLNVINSQADRLQRLIDNLLNLARIEAGVVKVSKLSQSLNEILEEAFHVIQPAAEQKGIELTRDLSPLYLGVLADRDMLLQCAINLLSNAVKYTPSGRRVTLRSRLLGTDVLFEVEDHGVGLSPEDQQRVFEKFYRVKKDQNMAVGTGLGLPLARHIVQDIHGGQLTVESQLDVGSKFCARLPGAGQMH